MQNIPEKMSKKLPVAVTGALEDLPEKAQEGFVTEFQRRSMSPGIAILLLILLPGFHFFQHGFKGIRILQVLLFWLTLGGFGVWWLLEFVLAPKRVRKANQDLAMKIVQEVKSLYGKESWM